MTATDGPGSEHYGQLVSRGHVAALLAMLIPGMRIAYAMNGGGGTGTVVEIDHAVQKVLIEEDAGQTRINGYWVTGIMPLSNQLADVETWLAAETGWIPASYYENMPVSMRHRVITDVSLGKRQTDIR